MKIMVRWNHMKVRREISVSSLLKKLRSGFQTLSNIEWASTYGFHLSAATILGVFSLMLAFRDGRMGNVNSLLLLSTKRSSSEKPYFVPGLRNLGNNCFLNVVLQSLASCLRFRYFLEDVLKLQASSSVEQVDELPLLLSLSALLEGAKSLKPVVCCRIPNQRGVFVLRDEAKEKSRPLNPQKVMSAMQQYIPQFQLSNQQDAAEAFLHLLSCLRDELSASYMPNYGSLANVAASNSRILPFARIENLKEPERWRQQYLGPFDGILSSFLTCQTCSSEIMMDSGFFHTLPLTPNFNPGSSTLEKFTLEDCIKRFLAPEHIENYSCSCCWHSAAIKFLSSVGGQQEDISKLSCCSEPDSCDCRNISSLQTLPWSNHFSHAFKQLSIAHCPQILCLYLQRSSLNAFGELVKIQGHICFPLILNLSPFAKFEVGIQKQKTNKPKSLAEKPCLASISNPRSVDRTSDRMTVKVEASQYLPEPWASLSGICSNSKVMHTFEVTNYPPGPPPPKNTLYRLVSVAEHFGGAGSGHYTVYRGVTAETEEGDIVTEPKTNLRWFRISDSDVQDASEEEVLGAEATLLFYERI